MASQQGVELDYSDTSAIFLYPTIFLNLLATIVVGLRIYARRFQGSRLQYDDYIVIIALIFDHAQLIDEGIMIAGGLGINGQTLIATRPDGVRTFLQAFFAVQLIYSCLSPLVKLSILALYYRIFSVSRTLRVAVWIMTSLLVGWGVSVFFASIFSCNPISGFWDLSIGAKCFDSALFFMAITVPNILLDVAAVVLPIREVWKLQMARDRKLALTAMFIVGGFVVLAAIARLVTVQLYKPAGGALNTTQALVPALLATSCEVNLAIFGACLPPILPLWRHWFGDPNGSPRQSKSTPPLSSIITIGRRYNKKRVIETTGSFERLDDGEQSSTHELNRVSTNDELRNNHLVKVSARSSAWGT